MLRWSTYCSMCGQTIYYEISRPRICPYCHYDMWNKKLPGENGYGGVYNYPKNNYNNDSRNNTPTPLRPETDKYLANKKDLPKTAYFKCSCGKVSMLEMDSAKCPKCGRRLTDVDIISEKEAKAQAPKSGCLGLILIPLIIGGGLIALL